MRSLPPLAVVALLLAQQPAACAPSLDVLVYPNAGVFEAGPGLGPGGPGGALLKRMQTLSGITLRQQVAPMARSMLLAEQKPGSCAVALSRTAERESRFQWVGPWARGSMTVYGRGDEARRIESPQDLGGHSLVVLRDSSPSAWLKGQGLAADEVMDNGIALRMLQARRVDFWVANDVAGHFVIKAAGGVPPRVLYAAGRIDLYFACHLATDRATIRALDAAIARLRRNGELAEFGLGPVNATSAGHEGRSDKRR